MTLVVDRLFEGLDVLENAAPELGEPALHQVEPGRGHRNEVEVETRLAPEPAPDGGMLVGLIVVQHQVEFEFPGDLLIQTLEEPEEVPMAIPLHASHGFRPACRRPLPDDIKRGGPGQELCWVALCPGMLENPAIVMSARFSNARSADSRLTLASVRTTSPDQASEALAPGREPDVRSEAGSAKVFLADGAGRAGEVARRAWRSAPYLLLALGLANCGGGDGVVPAECLPGEAPETKMRMAGVDSLSVYLDVSQSSTNFGRGRGESAYRDLIAWLLGVRSEFGEDRIHGFADTIAEVEEDVFVQAANGEVNPCDACGFSESRLDDVLGQVAAPESRASLVVVVTDLWLENSGLIGSARLALQRPIRSILADGRAIGVLGVAAPYSDQVYDVPNGEGTATVPAGRVQQRPVFALVIGAPGQVVELERRITREVFADAAQERGFAVFVPTLAPSGPARHRLTPRGPAVRPSYVLANEANFPGFIIDRRMADPFGAVDDSAGAGPALSAPIAADEHAGAPSPAAFELTAAAWTLFPPEPSAACDDAGWQRLDVVQPLQLLADSEPGSASAAVGLDVSDPDLLTIRPGEITFIRYQVAVSSLDQSGSATAWLDEWSFDAEDGPTLLRSPPPLFPSLNLSEFGGILRAAMAEEVVGEIVAGGGVLLSME